MVDRRARVAALALALLGAPACGRTPILRPVTPGMVSIAEADVQLELVELGAGLSVNLPGEYAYTVGTTVRLRWHAREDGTGIARAFLVPPQAPPCTAGLAAELIDADGQTRWDRPLGLGRDHVLGFAFPGDDHLDEGPLVVDVLVTSPRGSSCLRVPLTTGGQRFVETTSFAGAFGASLAVPLRRHSTPSFRFGVGAGRWVGPIRLLLHLGMGLDAGRLSFGSDDSGESGGSKPRFVELHVTPELTYFPVVRRRFSLGLSLGCELAAGGSAPLMGTSTDLERDESYWAPRLGLILTMGEARPYGLSTGRPPVGPGLEVFGMRASSWPRDPDRGAAWVLGVGVTW